MSSTSGQNLKSDLLLPMIGKGKTMVDVQQTDAQEYSWIAIALPLSVVSYSSFIASHEAQDLSALMNRITSS